MTLLMSKKRNAGGIERFQPGAYFLLWLADAGSRITRKRIRAFVSEGGELTEYGSKTPEQQKAFVEERAGQKLKLLCISWCRCAAASNEGTTTLTPEEALLGRGR